MQRSSVDFPEPDLPSRATISPGATSRLMPSSTGGSPPSRVGNVLVTLLTETIARRAAAAREPMLASAFTPAIIAAGGRRRSQRVAGLGEMVEAAPQQAVDDDHIHRHHGDAAEHL